MDSSGQQGSAGERRVEDLIGEHASELRAFVRLRSGAMLRSLESPSDLVQSVCREILEHKDRFRHPDKDGFRQWLYTTAARKIAKRVEYYRAQKRDAQRVVPIESEDELRDVLQRYGAFSSPTGALRTQEEVQRIEKAFDELPDDYREVITLLRIAGLPIEKVAAELQRSEAATRMLLFRALARLAELLEEPS